MTFVICGRGPSRDKFVRFRPEFLNGAPGSLSGIDRLTQNFEERDLATAVLVWAREMGNLNDFAQATTDGGQAYSDPTKLAINQQVTKIRAICEPLMTLG